MKLEQNINVKNKRGMRIYEINNRKLQKNRTIYFKNMLQWA